MYGPPSIRSSKAVHSEGLVPLHDPIRVPSVCGGGGGNVDSIPGRRKLVIYSCNGEMYSPIDLSHSELLE